LTENSGIRVKRVSRDTAADHPADDVDRTSRPGSSIGLGGLGGSRETKPFFLTSEFVLTVATIIGLLAFGYANGDDTLHTWRTWLLVTTIAAAYVLSRGIAKAGSRDR
jgi:hypothetical protein